LLEQWDEFRLDWGTSSFRPSKSTKRTYGRTLNNKYGPFHAYIHPGCFTEKQRYAVIVLAHGGDDLEVFQFDPTLGWVEAAGVFFQVASALASAEDWTEFEVRNRNCSSRLALTGSPPLSILFLGE
jgi:hypothetical protein